mmetsp:Transcript_19593/g.45561  ORF Transcript_19593/g.45561 Transcript_19593/m.45561 type:complete len:257 (-) Transcript_19593:1037-1807(-)
MNQPLSSQELFHPAPQMIVPFGTHKILLSRPLARSLGSSELANRGFCFRLDFGIAVVDPQERRRRTLGFFQGACRATQSVLTPGDQFRVFALHVVPSHFQDILPASQYARDALVNVGGGNVHDSVFPGQGQSTRLLYQKCHRRCFVQQPQFAIGVLDVGRIPKDSSVLQGSVDVTDHRSDVSAGVARFRVSQSFLYVRDILLERGVPVPAISFVERINLSSLRDLNVRMGQNEFTNGLVQSEAVHTTAQCEDEGCR